MALSVGKKRRESGILVRHGTFGFYYGEGMFIQSISESHCLARKRTTRCGFDHEWQF